jgi:hypothetical protein
MGKKSGSGSGMNNADHISQSLETIFGLNRYLNSLMRIRDGNNTDPGSEIRDKHPGSATLRTTSVAGPDPGSGAFFTPGSGMGKK